MQVLKKFVYSAKKNATRIKFGNTLLADVDHCKLKPCKHKGICKNLHVSQGYECSCQLGYTGVNCEKGTVLYFIY